MGYKTLKIWTRADLIDEGAETPVMGRIEGNDID